MHPRKMRIESSSFWDISISSIIVSRCILAKWGLKDWKNKQALQAAADVERSEAEAEYTCLVRQVCILNLNPPVNSWRWANARPYIREVVQGRYLRRSACKNRGSNRVISAKDWDALPSGLISGLEFHASCVVCSYCSIKGAQVIGRVEPSVIFAHVNMVSVQISSLELFSTYARESVPLLHGFVLICVHRDL